MNIYTSPLRCQGNVRGGDWAPGAAGAPARHSSMERTSPFGPQAENYFFFAPGAMASLAALATRNFTTVLAAILIASPVAGFRPIRALRFDLTSRPMPGRTNT